MIWCDMIWYDMIWYDMYIIYTYDTGIFHWLLTDMILKILRVARMSQVSPGNFGSAPSRTHYTARDGMKHHFWSWRKNEEYLNHGVFVYVFSYKTGSFLGGFCAGKSIKAPRLARFAGRHKGILQQEHQRDLGETYSKKQWRQSLPNISERKSVWRTLGKP